MNDNDRSFIVRLAALVLAGSILAMIGVMLSGLFNSAVDNKEIFAILGPSYQMIIGCLIGLVSGMRASSDGKIKEGNKE